MDPKNNIPSKTPNLRRLFGRLALLVGEKIELGMPMDVVFLEKKPVYTPTRFIYTYSLQNLLFFGVTEKTRFFRKNQVFPNPWISKTMIP